MYVIYRHVNVKNGKSYIGLTSKGPYKRWKEHLKNAINDVDFVFYRAIRKYGDKIWKHDILEYCQTRDLAFSAEMKWISRFQTQNHGYNMTCGGDGVVGFKRTPEQKKKLSEIAKKRDQVTKQAWIGVNVGRKHSDETRAKWSSARLGRKHSQETLVKLRGRTPWNKGKKLSKETCDKMSRSRTGSKNHFFGKKHSDETLDKIRTSKQKGKHANE
jgi:group I intron endonuclease